MIINVYLKKKNENCILLSEFSVKESKRDKDFLWVQRILLSGTLSDKISAYTVLVQECPVYNINSIETMINMVNIKGKRECLMAMGTYIFPFTVCIFFTFILFCLYIGDY